MHSNSANPKTKTVHIKTQSPQHSLDQSSCTACGDHDGCHKQNRVQKIKGSPHFKIVVRGLPRITTFLDKGAAIAGLATELRRLQVKEMAHAARLAEEQQQDIYKEELDR